MGRPLAAALALAVSAATAAAAAAAGHGTTDEAAYNAAHGHPLPDWYNGGLAEYSVVYTDRALNHMSAPFKGVMKDLNRVLTEAYNADTAVIMPGSGTFAMEAAARQLATGKAAVVVRNGFFSYRWTDIFDTGGFAAEHVVVKGGPAGGVGPGRDPATGTLPQYAPPPISEVAAAIRRARPAAVFAPQVETSVGVALTDEYIASLSAAAHDAGALLVLDAIAAGTAWVDMAALGVDVLITAPQKGWSAPACAGVVMLSAAGRAAVEASESSTMALNLKRWLGVMDSYLSADPPGHSYYATLPTDALRLFRDAALETQAAGWGHTKRRALELGRKTRHMMAGKGLRPVAADEFAAPGVVVVYTTDAAMPAKLAAQGLQVAAGVPWKLGEDPSTTTFRIGLFGLDKLAAVDATVAKLAAALDAAMAKDEL